MRFFFLLLFFFCTQAFSQQLFAQWTNIYDGIAGALNLDLNLYEHIDKLFISERKQSSQKISKNFNKKFDQVEKNNADIKKVETKRILPENSNDTLSEFCNYVGYITEVSIDKYYCFNQEVIRAEFESNKKTLKFPTKIDKKK